MNKKFRLVWLILVMGIVLGLGHWQEASAATITVTNLGDGAANAANCPHATICRLRDAIAKAASGDTISFSVSGTITLLGGQLIINKNLTIQGPGAAQLKISGNNTSRVFLINPGISATLSGLTIANGNAVSSGGGGGIGNSGTLIVSNSTLSGNVTDFAGGGIYNDNLGRLTLINSTLSGNSASGAGVGGGILSSGTATLTNSILSGNSSNAGGGIYIIGGTLTLTNCTLSGNSASINGGGIYNTGGNIKMRNTIVAGNTTSPRNSDDIVQGSQFTSLGYNLTDSSTGITPTTGDLFNVNPRLSPLGNYGGQTQTHALLPGSPAINAGNNCVLTNSCASDNLGVNLTTDQRGAGFLRQVGGTVDIGAFESRGFTLALASGNNQSAALNTAFATPLAVTVAAVGAGEPVSGGQVTFTSPVSGASCAVAGNPATITGNTATTGTVTANAISGTYAVAAIAKGATSVNFALTNFCIPLNITMQPASQVVCAGQTATFKVTATGSAPLSYQWRKNGVNISGATASNYTTPATTAADNDALYTVVVTGCGTPVTSASAKLTVEPVIISQPQPQTACLGSTATFSVAATGAGFLTYQWRKNGVNIAGATSSSYTTPATTAADNGALYTVVVTGTCGTPVISASAKLTVGPVITTQPPNKTVCPGPPVVFSVAATGVGLTYQWRKNGVNIAGATSNIYITPATTDADNGALYSVVVTSSCGASVTSANATLTFTPNIVFVLTGSDSDGGSLRKKLASACPGSTIRFVPDINLITLTSGPIIIDKNVTIQGPGADLLTISGNNTNRVFQISQGASVTLRDFKIANGAVNDFGGGIYNKGALTIENSTLSNNSAINGGGISNEGSLTLINSMLSNNSASSQGGGIDNRPDGIAAITNSLLTRNDARSGGGVWMYNGGVTITNSTLSRNSASSQGGGIYNRGNDSRRLYLTNCTITGNSVTLSSFSGSGGIYQEGVTYLRNTIIAGNTRGSSAPSDVFRASGSFTSLGYNLIGSISDAGILPTTGDQFGAPASPINPLLSPLGNYGGQTQTHAPLPGSPAINAGNNCVLTNSCTSDNLGFNLTTDQRGAGFNRRVGSAVDIGAFESKGFTLAVASGNNQSAAINTSFANPLAVTVTAVGTGEPVSGGQVAFIPPISGASATIAGTPATINGTTATTGAVTANATSDGPYIVAASAKGAATGVNFSLTNTSSLLSTTTNSLSATADAPELSRQQGGKAKVVGDYDGDGKSDLAIWRGEEGQWQIILSSTGEMQTAKLGDSSSPEDVPVSGDFDGDGKADLAVFRRDGAEAGHWYIKRSSDGEVADAFFGLGSDVPVAADYDGDGKTDIAVWRGAETTWHILRSSDHQEQTVSWGTSRAPFHDVPVPADYDGDGKADVAVFRQANGHWYVRQSSDGAVIHRAWGLWTDVPVAADYDGDGKADIAVWRGAEGAWYVLRSSDGTTETVSWGASSLGEWAVPGDYDGDGKADVAFWRASEGVWYVKSSADASTITKTHGQSGDRPVNARQQSPNYIHGRIYNEQK